MKIAFDGFLDGSCYSVFFSFLYVFYTGKIEEGSRL
jgi:hypothetical protein